jgi:hypothetical protein
MARKIKKKKKWKRIIIEKLGKKGGEHHLNKKRWMIWWFVYWERGRNRGVPTFPVLLSEPQISPESQLSRSLQSSRQKNMKNSIK